MIRDLAGVLAGSRALRRLGPRLGSRRGLVCLRVTALGAGLAAAQPAALSESPCVNQLRFPSLPASTSGTFRVSLVRSTQICCRAARATASYALQALAAPPPPLPRHADRSRPLVAASQLASLAALVVKRAHSPSRVPCSPPPPPPSVPNGGLICLPFTLTTAPPPPPPPPPPPAHWGGLVVLQARRAARAGGPNPRRTAARAVHTCVWRAACA